MIDFYAQLRPEAAAQIEQLSRVAYELRENRRQLLQCYDAPDEAALLERLRSGALPEHPGYDHYLAACAPQRSREAANAALKALLKEMGG